ncbi:MAG: amidase, partial [Gemmatimonadales bacterium]
NRVPTATRFSAILPGRRFEGSTRRPGGRRASAGGVRLTASDTELAFLPAVALGHLLRTRQVTSTRLTELYLNRLERYDPSLRCVVALTRERALTQAREADRLLAQGRQLGPLHGVPYGVKDILSVPGYPTTWGAAFYQNRIIDETATVVERLDAAGAVLVAKLAMGELGLNDTWYRGQTMNPWVPTRGATGSSSGSAVATAAGLVGFAIGAETMGSIVSPSSRTGVTGLRPTFGRVSRHGAMTLCWSLDKIGPMARSVEDCAVILEAIAGPDGKDPSVEPIPFAWDPDRPLASIRVGYFKAAFDAPRPGSERDAAALRRLADLGVNLVPVELPTDLPVNALLIVRVEAAAAFGQIAGSPELARLTDQGETGWPNFIRSGQFVPAVDYLQAQRIRTMLMERLDAVFQAVDVFVTPTFGVVPVTNLTGHPVVVAPNGRDADGVPASLTFVGRLFDEARLCTVARAWQDATGFHQQHPTGFDS